MNEREQLKEVIRNMNAPEMSEAFKEKLYQDWHRQIHGYKTPKMKHIHVIALARTQYRFLLFFGAMALMIALIFGQKYWNDQEEGLNRVDTLSELSLSTL